MLEAAKAILAEMKTGAPRTAEQVEEHKAKLQSLVAPLRDLNEVTPTVEWQQTLALSSTEKLTPQEEEDTARWLERTIMTENVLFLGSETFTHTTTILEKYVSFLDKTVICTDGRGVG